MASQNKTQQSAATGKRDRNSMHRFMMSERQLDAYLSARDVIRRIQRTSSLVFPAYGARSGSLQARQD